MHVVEVSGSLQPADPDDFGFDNRAYLAAASAAAMSGEPGMECHPDYRQRELVLASLIARP